MRQQDRISERHDERHRAYFYLARLGRQRGHKRQAIRMRPIQ
jgi:hypothetical protein